MLDFLQFVEPVVPTNTNPAEYWEREHDPYDQYPQEYGKHDQSFSKNHDLESASGSAVMEYYDVHYFEPPLGIQISNV